MAIPGWTLSSTNTSTCTCLASKPCLELPFWYATIEISLVFRLFSVNSFFFRFDLVMIEKIAYSFLVSLLRLTFLSMRHLCWGVPGISLHGGFPLSTGNSFLSKGMAISLPYTSSLTILFKRTSIYVFFPTDIRKWWNSAPMSPKRSFSTVDILLLFFIISLSLKIYWFDKFRNLKLRYLLLRYRGIGHVRVVVCTHHCSLSVVFTTSPQASLFAIA